MKLTTIFPILEWLPGYNRAFLKGDLAAGLTVGVMLIPQGMAYAMIAGLPPIYGLYASTLPLILYALLGTSRQLAVGPAAMVSLLTAAGIGTLAEAGTTTYLSLCMGLALLVGLGQFLLGIFKLGFLANFLSHPVISGFTSAAALIIGFSQLKHLLGVELARSSYIHEVLFEAIQKGGEIHPLTLAVGLGGIACIIGVKRIHKALPAPLIVVALGIACVWLFGWEAQGIALVGYVPEGLPQFSFPSMDRATFLDLLPIALTISLISFMESIAIAKTIQAKHQDYEIIPSQELIALGVANMGSALFQAFPVTGGLSRTAVNDQAGAKTGMALIISACFILLTLLLLTPVFYFLPKAILASVIMVVVFRLIDIQKPIRLWKSNRSDFWMLIVTFLATLSLGIVMGIGIGVALSLLVIVFQSTRPHIAMLGQVPGTHFYRNVNRFDQVIDREDLLIIRFDGQLYFANINYFKDSLYEMIIQKGDRLKVLIISAESINNMDSSAIQILESFIIDLKKTGLQVLFAGVIGPVRDAMLKSRFTEHMGSNNFFMTVQEAVNYFDRQEEQTGKPPYQEYTMQSNP